MKFKNSIIIMSAALSLSGMLLGASRSFFVPRQITFDPTYELALRDYFIYHNAASSNLNLFATPFYQKSTNKCDLARYFLKDNKTSLTIRQDGTGDIGSLWLGIVSLAPGGFNSLISIAPTRQTYGANLGFRYNFNDWYDGWWFQFNTALVQADHNLNFRECAIDSNGNVIPGGTIPNPGICDGITNATVALNSLPYGNFSTKVLSRIGLDDLQFKLGYDFFYGNENNHLGFYAVASAPTGKKNNARYIFEPIVGSRHGSVGGGLNFDHDFFNREDNVFCFLLDCKYRYVFGANELRSFDLKQNGDYSRYLRLIIEGAPRISYPATEFLTQKLRITPCSTVDLWSALHYAFQEFNVEAGYVLWYRSAEKASLKSQTADVIGIYDLAGVCQGLVPAPTTGSTDVISDGVAQAVSDPVPVYINPSDYDLRSATHPVALSNKVYAGVSYNTLESPHPMNIGVGGSYEFAHNRNALEQYAVWMNLNISF